MFIIFKLTTYEVNNIKEKIDYTIPYGIEMVNATKMWENGFTGKDVTIAVIDTGCDINHPALKDRILGGRNFTDDDNGNIYNDYQGHGTHVAGTIAGNKTEVGITGVAPDAKLFIMKALDRNGVGKVEWIINAIYCAVDQNVDIISMSLGCPNDDKALREAVDYAISKGVLVVCASGNDGDGNEDTNEMNYPGAYDEVIVVGAIDKNKKIANFSNTNIYIDVVAPGVEILSTYKNGTYATLSGTSMATPHVTGVLALLIEWSRKEFGRNLTETEYYSQLIKNTTTMKCSRKSQGNGFVRIK